MSIEFHSLTGAKISGKALPMMDRQVLRDISITSVGRQLEILQAIQEVVQPADKPRSLIILSNDCEVCSVFRNMLFNT